MLILFRSRILSWACPVLLFFASSSLSQSEDFFDGFEEVTKEPSKGYGATFACGEGDDKGIRTCVDYYNCDPKTNTIISSGDYDGTGLIDIRIQSNRCDHPLQVCCDIPKGGIPPDVKLPNTSTDPMVNPNPEPGIPPDRSTPSPNPVGTVSYCGIRNENGIDFKITGDRNNEAQFGEFPWMVALLRKTGEPTSSEGLALCGGSLITPNVVLTGAHCVSKFQNQPSDLKVRVGEWDTQTTRERLPYQERDVVQIVVHEGFRANNLFNDVALLVLASPVDKYDHIGTICLPSQNLQFTSRDCFATGWGKDVFGRKGQPQVILKKIQLPIVPHNICQDSLRKTRLGLAFALHSSFICAGGEPGKDTCTVRK
ncbi:phenoloxidase-activating factor 2 [Agrilus planipennis]|uniref:Phenoloxidase-activating factor 2 n=1 Tax=Agrilus planipennis TaxID=224129 RepID=A0A7F5RFK1_AGRPL|nr:phenoloxidase-activating factor 2 [Agrilus planipennis]